MTSRTTPWLALTIAMLCLAVVVAGYFWWLRRPVLPAVVAGTLAAVVGLLLCGWLYPFTTPADTRSLALVHLPIVLAVLLGSSYLGNPWRDLDRWMDYVRFLGELFVYYVLIALGGGVLIALTQGVFALVGLDVRPVLSEWVLPLGAGGAVIVAAWLVEAKKSVVENMAPVLTAVFTPLFGLVLLAFLGAVAVTGRLIDLDRNALIIVDLVLAVVLALLVFSLSARPDGPPRPFDWLQFALVLTALAIDLLALVAMAGRIGEFGASPNKVAALGENLLLAVNLGWAARLHLGFLRGRTPLATLAGWQCRFLPVFGGWAAAVVVLFPPLFGFR